MKIVFFLFLVLNSVFLVWELTRGPDAATGRDLKTRESASSGDNRIVLVGEQPGPAPPLRSSPEEIATNPEEPRRVQVPEPPTVEISWEPEQPVSKAISGGVNRFLVEQASAGLKPQVKRYSGRVLNPLPDFPEFVIAAVGSEVRKFPLYRPREEKRCYQLGPWFSRRQLYPLSKRLKASGLNPIVRSQRVDRENGYMVIYPPAESVQAARENLKFLKSRGIRDLWLINRGELQDAISLGVFRRRESAELMQQDLRDQGIAAEVRPKYSKKTGFFLAFESDRGLDSLRALLAGIDNAGNVPERAERGNCKL